MRSARSSSARRLPGPSRKRRSAGSTAALPQAGSAGAGEGAPAVSYAPGTWGPAAADALMPAGEEWHEPAHIT